MAAGKAHRFVMTPRPDCSIPQPPRVQDTEQARATQKQAVLEYFYRPNMLRRLTSAEIIAPAENSRQELVSSRQPLVNSVQNMTSGNS